MRRIVARHTLLDTKGYAWDAEITVPWDKPGEAHLSHGPATPLVTLLTPDDPEHWAYGEDGPAFDLSFLRTVIALANPWSASSVPRRVGKP